MSNYFYDMQPAAEREQLAYIPTVPQFMAWIEEKWSDRPALTDDNGTITYGQMCERVARRRSFLNSQGLAKGDLVAIWERSGINAFEMFLAVASAGFVAVNLPTQMPPQAVDGVCRKFGVRMLLARDEFRPGMSTDNLPYLCASSASMADDCAPLAQVDKEAPAAIFFTGGTTGAPKGAILPHRALMRGAFNGSFGPGPQFGQKYVCMLPLCHVFGMIRSSLSVLYTGSEWVACEDMKRTIGKLSAIKPSVLVLVPGLCDILAGLAKMYGPQFLGGQLHTIVSGAANVPPRLKTEFDKLGISLIAGYGMTEAANLTAGNIDIDTKPTSVGKIYPEQEVKIVDGELWIKGDNLFTGYFGNPEETAKTLTPDGWLRTGDLVRFDEDGFMYITGRIKNVIILSSGENVSPETIEEPFYQDPCVKDCLVSEADQDGNRVIAVEILPQMPAFDGKSESEIDAYFKNLLDKVNSQLPSTHRVMKYSIRKEDFKRSGSLKVLRNQN